MSLFEGFFSFGRFIVKPFARKRFGFECDDLSEIEGPYLFLSNHTTDYDPIFVSLALGRPVHFVASEHLAHKGLISRLLILLAKPILHLKGKMGIRTTKEILKTLKKGGCVALFPEGGRSFNGETSALLSSTAKLAKGVGVKIVTARIIGGYEVQPRWGVKLNKGRVSLRLSNVYEADEVKAMDEEVLRRRLSEDLFVRASVPQDLTGIESTLFLAGPEEIGPDMNIAELDRKQKEYVMAGKGDFTDTAELYEVREDHRPRLLRIITLKANRDGFSIDGEPLDIEGLAIISRNTLVLHTKDRHYEIRGGTKFSGLKYIYQYEYLNTGKTGESNGLFSS